MTIYEPEVSSQIYGLHIPYDKGYDAHSQRNFPRAENRSPSGYFQRGDGSVIALWITEISSDFSLSGQIGQSRMTREFYPRSFNDVKLHIRGNVASNKEYNRLALFVREHQWKGLNYINQGGTGVDQTITFVLNDNTHRAIKNNRQRTIKGNHQSWSVQGYISSIAAGATAHNVAPQFDIDFIICQSTKSGTVGLWSEILETPKTLSTFVDLVNFDVINRHTFTGFIPTPPVSPPPKSKPPTQKPPSSGLPSGVPTGPWSVGVAYNPFSEPIPPFGSPLSTIGGTTP